MSVSCVLAPAPSGFARRWSQEGEQGHDEHRPRLTCTAYIVRRLLALIPTLFFASLIVFVTVRLIPGSVIDMMLSQNDIAADKMSRDQLIAALGLDKPMWEQYLALGRRHPAARRFRPLAVAEHAGRRAAGRAPARHLPARPAWRCSWR